MKILKFQVTTFSNGLFSGNLASVCLLDSYLPDDVLLKISQENMTPETAFVVLSNKGPRIRWFSSAQEVEMCGHGSIAACHVLKKHLGFDKTEIVFAYNGGTISVLCQTHDGYTIQLQERIAIDSSIPKEELEPVFETSLCDFFVTTSIVCVAESPEDVLTALPSKHDLGKFGFRSVILTAPGDDSDYVLRYFTPYESHYEDPATGVAQATLAPYWSKKLRKKKLQVKQLSKRLGFMECRVENEYVHITGRALTYSSGQIFV